MYDSLCKRMIKKALPAGVLRRLVSLCAFFALKYFKVFRRPFIVRTSTTDFKVFSDIYIHREMRLKERIEPNLIIDAGAYTGLSARYFHSKYPTAKILAIEPMKDNFAVLFANTSHIPEITAIHAGLWSRDCRLKLTDSGKGEWGFVTKETMETGPDTVAGVSMSSLLKRSGFDEIGILKIDIEGSEKEVFSRDFEPWLGKVKVLIAELHDTAMPGSSAAFFSATGHYEWTKHINGEKVIFVRKSLDAV